MRDEQTQLLRDAMKSTLYSGIFEQYKIELKYIEQELDAERNRYDSEGRKVEPRTERLTYFENRKDYLEGLIRLYADEIASHKESL